MATIHSRTFPSEIKICKKACLSCGLDVYQGPALEKAKKADVFWVGLSAVTFEEGTEKLPLSPLTRSGALIYTIEEPLRKRFSFYKTNLVKCAPLDEEKVRYPLAHEMEKCYPNLEWELEYLRPKMVLLLGKQVSDFIFKKLDIPKSSLNDRFIYQSFLVGNIRFVPVHHPSYMLVYKRKHIQKYTESIRNIVGSSLMKKDDKIRPADWCMRLA